MSTCMAGRLGTGRHQRCKLQRHWQKSLWSSLLSHSTRKCILQKPNPQHARQTQGCPARSASCSVERPPPQSKSPIRGWSNLELWWNSLKVPFQKHWAQWNEDVCFCESMIAHRIPTQMEFMLISHGFPWGFLVEIHGNTKEIAKKSPRNSAKSSNHWRSPAWSQRRPWGWWSISTLPGDQPTWLFIVDRPKPKTGKTTILYDTRWGPQDS